METKKLMVIQLVDPHIASFSLRYPLEDGKWSPPIVLTKNNTTYTTDNAKLIDWASRQKGLLIRKPDDKTYIKYLELQVKEGKPAIDNTNTTEEQAKEVKWNTLEEQQIIDYLEELGYKVVKIDPVTEGSTDRREPTDKLYKPVPEPENIEEADPKEKKRVLNRETIRPSVTKPAKKKRSKKANTRGSKK